MKISARSVTASALAVVTAGVMACSSMPKRRATPPEDARPPARLYLQLIDELGSGWSVEYVQVYLDGWLIWQGAPEPGVRSLGNRELPGAGKQELHVRVVAVRHQGLHGRLVSERKMLDVRPGSQRVQIKLKRHLFETGSYHVALDTR